MSTEPSLKVVGYDVEITFRDGTRKSFHKKGTLGSIARWAKLKPLYHEYVITGHYTQEQWLRCWGEGRM